MFVVCNEDNNKVKDFSKIAFFLKTNGDCFFHLFLCLYNSLDDVVCFNLALEFEMFTICTA